MQLLSHLKGKTHLEAVRSAHDNREPSRDELQRFNIAQIRDVPVTVINNNNANNSKAVKEKQKALKRRCRKIKQRMSLRGQEWEDKNKNETNQNLSIESINKAKFRRNLKELDRLYNNHFKSAWSNIALSTLERSLGEIVRAFSKSVSFIIFLVNISFRVLLRIIIFCLFRFSVRLIKMLLDVWMDLIL